MLNTKYVEKIYIIQVMGSDFIIILCIYIYNIYKNPWMYLIPFCEISSQFY